MKMFPQQFGGCKSANSVLEARLLNLPMGAKVRFRANGDVDIINCRKVSDVTWSDSEGEVARVDDIVYTSSNALFFCAKRLEIQLGRFAFRRLG